MLQMKKIADFTLWNKPLEPLKPEENQFLYHQSWSSTLKVQPEQLKWLELDSHVQVYWIFWEIFFLKKIWNMDEVWAVMLSL